MEHVDVVVVGIVAGASTADVWVTASATDAGRSATAVPPAGVTGTCGVGMAPILTDTPLG